MGNKSIKRSSTSLAIREIKIKTTVRFYLTFQKGSHEENKQPAWSGIHANNQLWRTCRRFKVSLVYIATSRPVRDR
ncbi:hypothetical protein I79_009108 [Cricetulus griseus]|uniref:Uncharacterized protein n=1 Tax=Cricetulus griseus TaxID=10029 RepID=G3HEW1_CRIGR|nr:hypothetical protein I79_009108 [Cricetulus griseus]